MRRSTSSSTSGAFTALAKRPCAAAAAAEGVGGKPALAAPTKKRVALGNLTNQGNGFVGRGFAPQPTTAAKGTAPKLRSTLKTPVVKGSAPRVQDANSRRRGSSAAVTSSSGKPKLVDIQKSAPPGKASDAPVASIVGHIAPCSNALSPSRSAGGSASFDETMSMSTCDSIKSPNFEYIDNADSSVIASLERRASDNLRISEHPDEAGFTWKREVLAGIGTTDSIADVDNNHQDPQFCATLACDIYRHLRTAETKKRPSTDFMEVIQKDINANMRAILIDWLVEVAEEYRLVPDTLYLTVNYIDRYLSGNEVSRQRLQLLGVACMLIASKYEEICAPQVEEFCYITDNTYFRDEVLQMEADVLKYLKFEMTAPTIKCFLRRFVRVAQPDESPSLQLEFLASYIAELTLLEYSFLHYAPSMIAASAVFLAKFMLQPTTRPWNATLGHYTSYKPSDLCECIRALHHLVCDSPNNTLPATREKYSQHKYKFVAKKYCSPSIPPDFLHDTVEQQ